MSRQHFSRRKAIQKASALIIGSAVAPVLLARENKPYQPKTETVFLPPGSGSTGKISGSDITFKLNTAQTAGHFGSTEMTIPPGQLGAPPHFHKTFDETCIVLEGTVHIMVEDEVYEAKAGAWHLRPRGKVHTFWNAGPDPAKIIELCSPGGHEAYMKELALLFENGARPQPSDLQALAGKYDITFRFDKLADIIKKYKVSL